MRQSLRSTTSPVAAHRVLQALCGWPSPTPQQQAAMDVLVRTAKTHPAGVDLAIDVEAEPRFLLAGWACWRFDLADGRRQIIRLILPGEQIGGAAFVVGGMSALTAIKTISAKAVEAVCPRPAATQDAGSIAALRAIQSDLIDQVVRLGSLSAYERLAHLMVELHRRLGGDRMEPSGFPFPLTQETLATALGTSQVHTNRVLQKLRKEGLISLRGGRLTIVDLTGLEQASGAGPAPAAFRRRLDRPAIDTTAAPA